MKILVIGGSRFVGPILLDQLAKDGHDLTVFNRGTNAIPYPDGTRVIQGDRHDGFSIKDHYDAVVDMCAFTGEDTQAAIEQLSFDHFIHFSTVAVYKKSEIFLLTEESELGELPTAGEYNRGKVACERVLAASNITYASIRPDYILGPNNYLDRENFIYQKLHRGVEIKLPGNGQALCQFVFVDEVAAIIKMVIEKKLTGAFNCAGDELITLKGIVELMGEVIGKVPRVSYNLSADGSNHIRDEFPFPNDNLITSNLKVKQLGFSFMSLRSGLQRDYDSYYRNLQD